MCNWLSTSLLATEQWTSLLILQKVTLNKAGGAKRCMSIRWCLHRTLKQKSCLFHGFFYLPGTQDKKAASSVAKTFSYGKRKLDTGATVWAGLNWPINFTGLLLISTRQWVGIWISLCSPKTSGQSSGEWLAFCFILCCTHSMHLDVFS